MWRKKLSKAYRPGKNCHQPQILNKPVETAQRALCSKSCSKTHRARMKNKIKKEKTCFSVLFLAGTWKKKVAKWVFCITSNPLPQFSLSRHLHSACKAGAERSDLHFPALFAETGLMMHSAAGSGLASPFAAQTHSGTTPVLTGTSVHLQTKPCSAVRAVSPVVLALALP